MPTNKKPLIGGTVRIEVRKAFVEAADELGITQSKYLDLILADYFDIEEMPLEFDIWKTDESGENSETG